MPSTVQAATAEITASSEQLKRSLSDMGSLGDQFAAKLVGAFEQVAVKGKKLEDIVRSLALSFSQLALKAALKPLESGLGSIINGLLSGLTGGLTGGGFGGGLVQPFAKGGVISSPVNFPLSDGRAAIAGEQGAEAILPLSRGADGQLGVRSGGGAVNVTFNVTTPDAGSFQRSQTQIAAMLQRGLAAGQRNL